MSKKLEVLGIIVAMPEEAESIIAHYKMRKMTEDFYTGVVDGNPAYLKICGIGKVNAQNSTWFLTMAMGADKIVNIGTCGDAGGHKPGELVIPTMFFDGDFDLSAFGDGTKDPAFVNMRYVDAGKGPANLEKCYTFSTFVDDARVDGSIVDMECYAIAAACKEIGVPFLALKCISDSADENAVETFEANVSNVVTKNIVAIAEILDSYNKVYEETYKLKED